MQKFWTDVVVAYWPVFMALVGYPAITAAANWYLWWDTPEHWEAFAKANPDKARWIRILRAAGPHLRKVVQGLKSRSEAASGRPTQAPPPPSPPPQA